MGSFFEESVSELVAGREGPYAHWFGGRSAHRGVIPEGREHPVHLLYDLDLRDPALGLASRFAGLSRLPLFNALQYNCCDMIYRVVSDDAIEIVGMGKPEKTKWDADFPFDNYPIAFPRTPVVAEPVAAEVMGRCISPIAADGGADIVRSEVLADACMFPRVGGRQFMWQGIPDWACPTAGCAYQGVSKDLGKEVFAVIWERPVPGVHLWSDDPKHQDVGSCEIIFSRCTGCGVVHSCNRCD